MSSVKELIVWNRAYDLTLKVYTSTKLFPKDEQFNLTSQIRRSVVSIPSNIAEGHARKGKKEFSQFLYIAFGSCSELETQLLIAKDLKYLKEKDFLELSSLLTEVMKMLSSLISKINYQTCIN